jgi:hypothetical protein
MKEPPIRASTRKYHAWLRTELGVDFVETDLVKKFSKMADPSPFPFLRATYWRWAETIYGVVEGIDRAPHVLAVGDIHLENFGTWRDADGRLVWGVNDFDEAAEMPYVLDLIRLAASAVLAGRSHRVSPDRICKAILEGYADGLKNSAPFVLDKAHKDLRSIVEVSEDERKDFWNEMPPAGTKHAHPRARYRHLLQSSMPKPRARISMIWHRPAGLGSLGRARWTALADWRGGPVLREAKALVRSAWTLVHDPRNAKIRVGEIATSRFRSPDPWYHQTRSIVLRRLSPNNRKIEIKSEPKLLLSAAMLRAMGCDLANVHRGEPGLRKDIRRDLDRRAHDWLHHAAVQAAAFITREHAQWRRVWEMDMKGDVSAL